MSTVEPATATPAEIDALRAALLAADAALSRSHLNVGQRLVAARRPVWPLSGLVRCGVCRDPMGVVANDGRLGCSNRRERGTCTNPRTLLRDRLLRRVFEGLKHKLLTPAAVGAFREAFIAEVTIANRERSTLQSGMAAEEVKLRRKIRSMLDLMTEGGGTQAMVAELRRLEEQLETVKAAKAAAATPQPIPAFPIDVEAIYRRKVEAIEGALQSQVTASLATEALRSLVSEVLVYPEEGRGQIRVELVGDLAAFVDLTDFNTPLHSGTPSPRKARETERPMMGTLVAGIGFEPMTFRL